MPYGRRVRIEPVDETSHQGPTPPPPLFAGQFLVRGVKQSQVPSQSDKLGGDDVGADIDTGAPTSAMRAHPAVAIVSSPVSGRGGYRRSDGTGGGDPGRAAENGLRHKVDLRMKHVSCFMTRSCPCT